MALVYRFSLLTVILGLVVLFSCEAESSDLPNVEDCEHYDYKDCNATQPYEASMTINFSITSQNKEVVFEVYKGYVDDNNLFFRDTSTVASLSYYMPVNEYWSVLAIYHRDGKTIKVIDGGKIKVHSKKVCDSTCWSVDDLVLDAVLK